MKDYKGKPGPKPKVIDYSLVEKLAHIQCTHEEIATHFVGMSREYLLKIPEYVTAYNKGKEGGKMSLRRMQFRLAETNAAMCIWLGKQYLGQIDKIEVSNDELINQELEFKTAPLHVWSQKGKDKYNKRFGKFFDVPIKQGNGDLN